MVAVFFEGAFVLTTTLRLSLLSSPRWQEEPRSSSHRYQQGRDRQASVVHQPRCRVGLLRR